MADIAEHAIKSFLWSMMIAVGCIATGGLIIGTISLSGADTTGWIYWLIVLTGWICLFWFLGTLALYIRK